MINKLFEIAPQIVPALVFLAVFVIGLREYRSLRGEIGTEVNDAVNGRLGSLIGDIQIKLGQASKTLQKMEAVEEKAVQQADAFESHMIQRQAEVGERLSEVRKNLELVEGKLEVLEAETPRAEAITARDRISIATFANSVNEALSQIERIENDPEARSADLEHAGDIAGQRGRNRLALKLYEKACKLDPERVSAKLEYLCVLAEIDYSKRKESLEEAKELALSQEANGDVAGQLLGTFDNVLIRLGRYAMIAELCREILASGPRRGSRIDVQARRDLAVHLRQQGEFAEAATQLEKIVEVAPRDENVLKLYLRVLLGQEDNDKALTVAKKLLSLDPLDARYYEFMAEAYQACENFEAAMMWLGRAKEMQESDAEKMRIAREMKSLALQVQLREEFETDGYLDQQR